MYLFVMYLKRKKYVCCSNTDMLVNARKLSTTLFDCVHIHALLVSGEFLYRNCNACEVYCGTIAWYLKSDYAHSMVSSKGIYCL